MEPLSLSEYIEFKDFHLHQPLWENIEKVVDCVEERTEIKKVVGNSIIDENIDLHVELSTLHDIWRETQQEEDSIPKSRTLPEPPFLRENLEKQITLLVDLLKQKLKEGDESVNLSEEDRRLIKSVSSVDRLCNSKQSLRDTPSSGYESRCSSALSVDLNSLQESMTVSDIDSIVQPLRDDFEEEKKFLLKDITYIQNVLIYESNMKELKRQRRKSSPSIKELQSLSNRLEMQVLDTKQIKPPTSPIKKKTMHRSSLTRSPKLKPIQPRPTSVEENTDSIQDDNNDHNTKFTPYPPYPPSTIEGGMSISKIPTPPRMNRNEKKKTSHAIRQNIKLKKQSEAGMVS